MPTTKKTAAPAADETTEAPVEAPRKKLTTMAKVTMGGREVHVASLDGDDDDFEVEATLPAPVVEVAPPPPPVKRKKTVKAPSGEVFEGTEGDVLVRYPDGKYALVSAETFARLTAPALTE